jgi:hypothetical protein
MLCTALAAIRAPWYMQVGIRARGGKENAYVIQHEVQGSPYEAWISGSFHHLKLVQLYYGPSPAARFAPRTRQ